MDPLIEQDTCRSLKAMETVFSEQRSDTYFDAAEVEEVGGTRFHLGMYLETVVVIFGDALVELERVLENHSLSSAETVCDNSFAHSHSAHMHTVGHGSLGCFVLMEAGYFPDSYSVEKEDIDDSVRARCASESSAGHM